ncbi:hypothetical protein NS365_07905 [Aureimonas ureilytica]|uniref:Uncharacterized protein n=1 Tax=Aureimonas ureilytica TaxID=401562 RepID=A0A175RSM5_9HYPH|nr:hypothetical protein NS365_07905 [Aureimonas ureilytica]
MLPGSRAAWALPQRERSRRALLFSTDPEAAVASPFAAHPARWRGGRGRVARILHGSASQTMRSER